MKAEVAGQLRWTSIFKLDVNGFTLERHIHRFLLSKPHHQVVRSENPVPKSTTLALKDVFKVSIEHPFRIDIAERLEKGGEARRWASHDWVGHDAEFMKFSRAPCSEQRHPWRLSWKHALNHFIPSWVLLIPNALGAAICSDAPQFVGGTDASRQAHDGRA